MTFVRPDGWKYEMTGPASSDAEAVRIANDMLEYVERVGIADFLEPDGLSVRPSARLTVTRAVASEAGSGFGLVITDPNGNVTRK